MSDNVIQFRIRKEAAVLRAFEKIGIAGPDWYAQKFLDMIEGSGWTIVPKVTQAVKDANK